jgi:hypothetical protein
MAIGRFLPFPFRTLRFYSFFSMLFLNGGGVADTIATKSILKRKGERMPKGRDKKEIRAGTESRTRSDSAPVRVIRGEKFELSEAESKLLGDLWDRQKSSSRSNYTFTDAPSCI